MISRRCSFRTFGAIPFALGCAMLTMPALAQDDEEDTAAVEEIVVTGSKLRRDEFTSISPVQVIGGQEAVRIGLVDTSQMIAESPVVFGTQLDGSVNSGSTTGAVEGVPASGPGSATVALRGLGPERTLMLINGRRLAPSGVRGAPIAPDLNLIPSAMIDRIEILTDGASSIYGADAVAHQGHFTLIIRPHKMARPGLRRPHKDPNVVAQKMQGPSMAPPPVASASTRTASMPLAGRPPVPGSRDRSA